MTGAGPLPPHVAREVQQILDDEAWRRLGRPRPAAVVTHYSVADAAEIAAAKLRAAEEAAARAARSANALARKNRGVYIVCGGGLVKIGRSDDVASRVRQIRSHSPVDLTLVRLVVCEDHARVERFLHERFDHLRVRGEWFSTDALTEAAALSNA